MWSHICLENVQREKKRLSLRERRHQCLSLLGVYRYNEAKVRSPEICLTGSQKEGVRVPFLGALRLVFCLLLPLSTGCTTTR